MATEQIYQYERELEQGVVAAAIADPVAFFTVPRAMTLEMTITDDLHRAVYMAALELHKNGRVVAGPLLCEGVVHNLPGSNPDDVMAYLKKLPVAAPRTENIEGYISALIERSTMRRVLPVMASGIKTGQSAADLLQLINAVRPQVEAAVNMGGDGLPDIECIADSIDDPPAPPPEIIYGVLRKGHKMLVAGPSKAGKSFLLVQLAIALAEGSSWVGFQCEQSKVLYLNFEIEGASMHRRFHAVYDALEKDRYHPDSISLWNLRGHSIALDDLVPQLIEKVRAKRLAPDVIILDPVYKVLRGDENNAGDMAIVCRQLDTICEELGCSVIYAHHHSKGYQSGKRSMDRASGSGVFARDPDAMLDLIQLSIPEHIREVAPGEDATAWRMEGTLREFRSFPPRDFWFNYPLHVVDSILEEAQPEGSSEGNRQLSSKYSTPDSRRDKLAGAFTELNKHPPVRVSDLARKVEKTEKTVRNWIDEFPDLYRVDNGIVTYS